MHNVIVPPHYPSSAENNIIFLYGAGSWQSVAVGKIRALADDVWVAAPGLRQSSVCAGWKSAYSSNPFGVESWISGMEYSLLCQAAACGVVVSWFSNLQELYDSGSSLLEFKTLHSPHLLIGVDSQYARESRLFLRGVLGVTHFDSLDDLCVASVDFMRRIKLRSEENLTWA